MTVTSKLDAWLNEGIKEIRELKNQREIRISYYATILIIAICVLLALRHFLSIDHAELHDILAADGIAYAWYLGMIAEFTFLAFAIIMAISGLEGLWREFSEKVKTGIKCAVFAILLMSALVALPVITTYYSVTDKNLVSQPFVFAGIFDYIACVISYLTSVYMIIFFIKTYKQSHLKFKDFFMKLAIAQKEKTK